MVDKGKGIADDYSSGKRKRDGENKSAHPKRKNLNVLQFFEDSAFEVDESDSSDDDVFINDVFLEDDFGPDIDVKAEPKTPNMPFFPKEEDMDVEELDRILEERYKPGSNFVKYAEDRATEAPRSDDTDTLMSHVVEPKIWKVKCMVGRERHSAFCLMQKYVDLQALGTKLQIVSAFAVEHVKGFIYIEAEKHSVINEACSGLCNIYPSRVSPIPVSDVPHLFSVRSKYSGVKVDTWARVKAGKYKGDLAQVVSVNEVQRKVTVKLVPRIDLQAVAEKFGGGVTGKKSTVPAPRLITSSELEAYRPLVQERHDRQTGDTYEVFDGMTLKDGYLFKKVPLDSLSFWDVRPSEAELIKFMPPNKEESNDVEWLTGLFGERSKKKKQTVNNDKTGEKGEGSSSMENSFEVPDLVFHGRKSFGIVIGREKDDRIKVLEEGTDKPVVVAVEARLLKKADFDKKFNAIDKHKKIISVNNTVRVLEGPLEDKRGIVKQIYKGVVFVHDENLQENCGYFCAKAQICERMESSADLFKGGKGGKSGGSGFEDFPTSPKSPLSPKKPFEGLDNNRNFEDKEGFSVGQSLRIRVGPLKGYMCRVMAIRYSDITVKLDSQHKILTVKAEHLAEVKGKSSGVSTGDGQDAAKPFDLLGEPGSSQGWMDGGVAAESGGGGWNTGGQTTERSSWAPFPAADSSLQPESNSANPFGSTDNDASKDGGGSVWETKSTQDQGTAWGAAAATEKKESASGGWGAGSSGTKTETSDEGGWGKAAAGGGEKKPAWGAAAPAATETGGWGGSAGGSNAGDGEGKSAWGSAVAATETSGWGSKTGGSNGGDGAGKSAWGSAATPATETGGWGAPAKKDEGTTGWGKAAVTEGGGGSSWGKKAADEGGAGGGWGKSVSVTADEGGSGWGSKKDEGGSSWGKAAAGGGGGESSWGNQDGGSSWSGGGSSWSGGGGGGRGGSQGGRGSGGCFKCGESGHMSRECPKGGGGGGGGNCFKCGESGHMSRECPQGGGGGGGGNRNCYKCGESGHMSRECPQGGGGGGGGGGGNCYKCGESGHMSRECPQGGGGGGGSRNCYKCGESGHMSRECPQGGGGGGGSGPKSCFKCGESGHMSRECPQGGGGGGGRSCYKCGESGHMSRECPQGGGGGGGGPKSCFKCGESGHMSRECPQGGGGGGRNCYKCGESGHMSRECPQGGGGGGGRNCYKCGESGHMSRECPQGGGGGGGGRGGGGGWGGSSGGWGSDKAADGGGGGWSSGNQAGGWGSKQASDEKKNDTQGGGGWGGGSKASDAQGSGEQTAGGWGSSGGAQTAAGGWGGGSKAAQGSGDAGDQSGGAGGWGSSNNKDDAQGSGSGWKKSGW